MAELADAQVSEACDGDIVEVQVLSSAPQFGKLASESDQLVRLFFFFTAERQDLNAEGRRVLRQGRLAKLLCVPLRISLASLALKSLALLVN